MSAAGILSFTFLLLPAVSFAQQPGLVLPIGHTMEISCVLINPNGKTILTTSYDHTLKLWDAARGYLLAELNGHTRAVRSAQFSPNGKIIVSASDDSTAKLWDAATGNLLHTLAGHKNVISSVVFSPDGSKVLTASWDKTARVWDVSSRKPLAVLSGHTGLLEKAHFMPDGKRIITSSADSTIRIWETGSGKLILNIKTGARWFGDFETSPDGKKILAVLMDSTAKIWDAATGKLLLKIIHHSQLNFGRFSPDGRMIATGSWGFANIWNASSGTILSTIRTTEENRSVSDGQFSPDGNKLITISNGGIIRLWNVSTGKLLADFTGPPGGNPSIQFFAEGKKILTAKGRSAKVWDAENGQLLTNLRGYTDWVNNVQYSPDGKKVLLTIEGHNTVLWDVYEGKTIYELDGGPDVMLAQFSPDGKKIITASWNDSVKIWDEQTGHLLTVLHGPTKEVNSVELSRDGKKIVTASFDKTAKIWDASNGKLLTDITGHFDFVYHACFSPDGKRIATASADETAKVWDVATGSLVTELAGHNNFVYSAYFSADGKRILTASLDNTVRIWDLSTGTPISAFKKESGGYRDAHFFDGEKKILVEGWSGFQMWDAVKGNLLYGLEGVGLAISPDKKRAATLVRVNKTELSDASINIVKLWDTEKGTLLMNIEKGVDGVKSMQFSRDGKNLVMGSLDNTATMWNAADGNHRYTFFPVVNRNYFTQIPGGYYQCTSEAAKLLHYVTKELKVITFEQLDVKYNRPDKVLEAIGNTDTALIKSYRKAWEKRIKKLGIDTTAFRDGYSVPEADFVNRDNIEHEQKAGTLKLHIKGMDSTYKLDRFNVWVNEAPVFGQRGINIKRKNSNSIDTTIIIKLSQGENRIETSITNVNGTESYRMPLPVNYTPAVKQKESLRFIGIGIDKFADPKNNLHYSSKDIRDLAVKLKEKYKDDIIIDTLFNEHVTISNVKALKQKLQQTTENDKVIISYSGHGLLSKEYDYYLSTYSINFDKPEENGLPYDELENLLDSIPARKKLMLIDACHSGEVDKEEITQYKAAEDSLKKQGTKGGELRYTGKSLVGMKNSFELMQSLFVNVGKSTGATIISAAGGTQFALERGDLKNGVFTYSILEAMDKNPTMKISELKKIVGERVEQLTNGLQKPTSRNETIAVDWSLW